MERMINRRLIQYLNDHNHLDHRQHAFRPGHGTNTYFGTLGQALDEAMKNGMHVELATLDIAKAYNRAWMPAVIQQLTSWGIKGHILHFIKNFLYRRTFQVGIGNHRSTIFEEETGVPQGSVLAVTLFLVRMNGVFVNLPAGIRIFVYADDIVLMVVRSTLKALRKKLIQAVNHIHHWSSKAGFQLAVSKCAFTHVCGHNHRSLSTPVIINDQAIPQRKSVTILGVQIDRSLSFRPHFENVKAQCRPKLNLVRSLARRHPDSNRPIRIRVTKAIVVSKLMYGIELTCMARSTLIEKLTPTYQRAIRLTSGLLPSTPGIAACVESGVLPFDCLVALNICRRTIGFLEKTTGPSDGVFLLEEAKELLAISANQVLPPVSRVHWVGASGWNLPRICIDHRLQQSFKAGSNPNAVAQSFKELVRNNYAEHTIRYSDGSVSLGRVGFGISDRQSSACHRLPDQCTIFSAEAAGVFVAVTTPAPQPIVVFTDSASVIAALEAEDPSHPWIQAILKYAPPNTTLAWIPGHCGIQGNIEADHLAASGRLSNYYTRKVPGQDLKSWVTKKIWDTWNRDWLNSHDPFIRKVKGETHRWEDPPDHRSQIILSRLRSGHTRASHNLTGNGDFRKLCSACRVHHSVEHFICHCPLYQGPRELYDIPCSIRDALSDDPSRSAALICFLKESGLYLEI